MQTDSHSDTESYLLSSQGGAALVDSFTTVEEVAPHVFHPDSPLLYAYQEEEEEEVAW